MDTGLLIVQLEDDPCGYNAVFHCEDGRLFCWNSDGAEMSCRDYPLRDGSIVRQYADSGFSFYTIFRYQSNGEKRDVSTLFAREGLIYENSSASCPYYAVDGKEVDQSEFEYHDFVSIYRSP